jgi:thiol-disulfide isomerase/thioredoxin
MLTGTLVGHDGKPMKLAHVSIGGESIQVGADGSFEAPLVARGFERVMLTGVDHGDYAIGLLLDGSSVHVDAKLGTYAHPESFDNASVVEVRFVGDDIALGKTTPLVAGKDGRYTANIEAPDGEFAYEIRGITAQAGRSMNSDEATEYRYDGDGNYANVVTAKGGSVTVKLDPARLLPSGVATVVTFSEPDSNVAKVSAVYQDLAQWRGGTDEETAARSAALAARIGAEEDATVRQALMIAYLSTLGRTVSREHPPADVVAIADRALAEIPASADLWGMSRSAAMTAVSIASGDGHRGYLEDMLASMQDPEESSEMLFNMMWVARSDGDEEAVGRYFATMKEQYAGTRYSGLAEMFNPDRMIRPGRDVPAFDLASFDDATEHFTPASFKGKVVLVEFWATWCGPCVEEMPALHAAHEKYKHRGFTILSVCADDPPDAVRKFRKDKFPMPWPNVVIEGDGAKSTKEMFEVAALPTQLLIGRDGKILATGAQLRGSGLDTALEKHLGK